MTTYTTDLAALAHPAYVAAVLNRASADEAAGYAYAAYVYAIRKMTRATISAEEVA